MSRVALQGPRFDSPVLAGVDTHQCLLRHCREDAARLIKELYNAP